MSKSHASRWDIISLGVDALLASRGTANGSERPRNMKRITSGKANRCGHVELGGAVTSYPKLLLVVGSLALLFSFFIFHSALHIMEILDGVGLRKDFGHQYASLVQSVCRGSQVGRWPAHSWTMCVGFCILQSPLYCLRFRRLSVPRIVFPCRPESPSSTTHPPPPLLSPLPSPRQTSG